VYFRQAAKNTLLVFGNENLISAAGVEPAMRLADAAGLADLTAAHVRLAGPQAASAPLKVGCLVTGMLMGADSIGDMGLLRDCGLQHVFTEVRAPSTLGSFLRSFDHGTVRQLQAVHRRLLPGLARRAPLLPGKDVLAYLDVDACQRRVYGYKKQGAAFGPARIGSKVVTVRGLNVLAAGVSTRTATTPLITGTRLRGGSAGDTRGAASFITEQINVAAEAGVSGDLLVRADSSYYNGPVISAIDRAGAFFSITMRSDPKNRRAIAAIPGDAWVAIRYPNAVYDEELRMWSSDAEVAEVPYTAFTSKKAHTTTGRMIVRRVRRLNPKNAEGQQALPGMPDEVTYRYHAVFTSNPHPMLEAEAEHRDHAVFEQIFADSIDGPLAHLPSGDFNANAAWVVLAAMTQNILRAAGALASLFHARARGATLRRDLINVPATTARTSRGTLTLRGIAGWYAEEACLALHAATRPGARGPTPAVASDLRQSVVARC
jgi:hypothetical protein